MENQSPQIYIAVDPPFGPPPGGWPPETPSYATAPPPYTGLPYPEIYPTPSPSPYPSPTPYLSPSPYPSPPPSSSAVDDPDKEFEEKSFWERYKVFIIIALVLLVIILGLGGYIFYKRGKK